MDLTQRNGLDQNPDPDVLYQGTRSTTVGDLKVFKKWKKNLVFLLMHTIYDDCYTI
jgi:hypothetical protein